MKRYHDPLFAPEKKRHPVLSFFLLLIIFLLAVIFLFNHINNSRVNLLRQSITITNLPGSMENYRILHISDLHGQFFGQQQERLAATLEGANYRMVLITGDVCAPDGSYDAFLRLLSILGDDVPVYFIPGDEDPLPILNTPHAGGEAKADYILAAEEMGAIYLDAPQKITIGSVTLWLDPTWVYSLDVAASEAAVSERIAELEAEDDSPERDAFLAAAQYQLDQLRRVRAARQETLETDLHIALTHVPLTHEAREELRAWTGTDNDSYVRQISLVLAGHYAAGQWRLPGFGPIYMPLTESAENTGWFPGDSDLVGLSYAYSVTQYISPGLGASRALGLPPFRFLNTPAVTQITLTGRMTD